MPVDEKYLAIPQNIEELDAFFCHQFKVIHEASFYFLHHAQIGQISEEIGRKQKEANERIHRIYQRAIGDRLKWLKKGHWGQVEVAHLKWI